MLGEGKVYPTIAVKDMDTAKKFYGETLGLKQSAGEDPGGMFYESGGMRFFVYQSQFAGSNKATYMSWEVDDINAVVDELKGKGVGFEHYDKIPQVKREGEIHIFGKLKAAWFKDPDGNILSIINQS